MAYAVDAYSGRATPAPTPNYAAGYGQYVTTRTQAAPAYLRNGYSQYVKTREASAALDQAKRIANLRYGPPGNPISGLLGAITGRPVTTPTTLPADAELAHAETLEQRSFNIGSLLDAVGLGDTSGTEDAVGTVPTPAGYFGGAEEAPKRDLMPLFVIGAVGLALAVAVKMKK